MKQNEIGRSMIEMLGVLAIIGVLSVMGLAAYSKAMAKHKSNQMIQYITQTIQHTRIAFGTQRDYKGMGDSQAEIANVMFNADLAPKEMLVMDANGEFAKPYVFKNTFKGGFSMRYSDRTLVGDKAAFVIHLDGLPKTACIDIATAAWGGANSGGYVGLTINQAIVDVENNDSQEGDDQEESSGAVVLTGNCKATPLGQRGKTTYCAGKGPIPMAAAVNGCLDPNNNSIEIKLY